MPDDTLTLVLSGDVSLPDFATAVSRLRGLVDALGREVAVGTTIDWTLAGLEYGSGSITVQGEVRSPGEDSQLQKVIEAYERVGAAIEQGEPVPYSAQVTTEVTGLTGILNGRIQTIRLETAKREAIIRSPFRPVETVLTGGFVPPAGSYGSITGRVQTLSNRGGLRFALYDTLHDRAVSCYLAEGHEDVMRDLWGRLASVEGLIRRDPETGRPLTIRDIRHIEPLPESAPEAFEAVRGISPSPKGLRAEDAIRRLRDA